MHLHQTIILVSVLQTTLETTVRVTTVRENHAKMEHTVSHAQIHSSANQEMIEDLFAAAQRVVLLALCVVLIRMNANNSLHNFCVKMEVPV